MKTKAESMTEAADAFDTFLDEPQPPAKRPRPPVPRRGATGIDINKRVRGGNGKMCVPVETIVALRNTGELSHASIAQILGISRQHVTDTLSRMDAKLRAVPNFRKTKSDLLAAKEMALMGHLDERRMAKAPLKDVAVALNVVHGIGRLEDGKSTQNVATYAQSRLKEEEIKDVVSRSKAELKQLMEENPEYADPNLILDAEDISWLE